MYDLFRCLDYLAVYPLAMSISYFNIKVEGVCALLCVATMVYFVVEKEPVFKEYKFMELITQSNQIDDMICPVAQTARIISGKWTLLIIRDLASGARRFNQLERSLQGISPKTLSERLRALEEEGIVDRQTFAEAPPRVEYSLTEKGRDLELVIESMRTFGLQWLCK